MNLIDSRVVAHIAGRQVLRQRAEVMWPDGTSVQLHQVQRHGLPCKFERALDLRDGRFLLFDLTEVARGLDKDLREAPARDAQGIVYYVLRQTFPTARKFELAVHQVAMTSELDPPSFATQQERRAA